MLSILGAVFLFFSIFPFTTSSFVVHYTSSGGICQNACGYHGYAYTWCQQSGGNGKAWDYCSLEEGLGASGEVCATPCAFWGSSYRSCYFEDGKWHYCGLIAQREYLEYSEDNYICIDNCRLDAAVGYFQCNTVRGLQRCSPFHDITPTGLPCHSNYRCAKYGHSVYLCHTEDNEDKWDHCGRKSLDLCVWFLFENSTSQADICTLPYSQKKDKIIFRREKRNDMLPFAKEDFRVAAHFIDGISSTKSFPDTVDLAHVRFYKQENIFCKGLNYTNIELWVDSSDDSTSAPIAHVIFPDILDAAEVLRLAFYTSLHSTFYQPAYTITVSFGEPMLCSPDL